MVLVVKKREDRFAEMAERAVEDAECGAQFEIKDEVLRAALLQSILRQLQCAYEMNA